MDLMRMDERQRLHWLMASRATLMVVGIVWLLMIAFELLEDRTPGFLIVMVPVFAGLRLGFYYFFSRDRDVKWPVRALFFLFTGLAHFAALHVAMVGEFATGRFLWVPPEEPAHTLWVGATRVLSFPLIPLRPDGSGAGALTVSWILAILNSAVWAAAVYLLVRAARRSATVGGARNQKIRGRG
jgi:hypothetical protein